MATTIYNGLLYTTKEINRNSRIKINGIVDGKKVNKLVGVKGLIELIGDGDCPECGGEMEVTDGEYRRTGGDGYLTPPEYSPIWEEKTCRNCGYKESNEPSY